jgi:uncharacterized protein YjbI with pentapeptide repeats
MAKSEHVELLLNDRKTWNELVINGALVPDLRGVHLPGADLQHRSLRDADLTGANLEKANLRNAACNRTKMNSVNLRGADLTGVGLASADLTDAILTEAWVRGTDFKGCNLTRAAFVGATLLSTVLRDSKLDEANFEGAEAGGVVFADLDLSVVRNLTAMRHGSRSTVGLDTIIRSQGKIPDAFLRGCGVPDEIILYARSLALSASPIQLYSCFISHSNRDHEYCERLHNDLQSAGVRCWFDRKDLKIGDRFRDEIEKAIRIHDKLLLVLSEHSVNSEWVQTEVESALEREQRERVQVLFPVRLDGAVMETPQAWAADVRRKRHIGDFSHWKEHDQYKKAFERLLRDLRAMPAVG